MQRKERGGRRPKTPAPRQAPLAVAAHDDATRPYDPLASDTVDALIAAALELLADSGVAFEQGSAALDFLRAGGCEISPDGVVRIDRALVLSALGSSAKSVRLWDRSGDRPIDVDCHHTWFLPGMTCIRVYDPDSGEPRSSTAEDLARITRLADALPNIDGVCVACKNVHRADIHGEIEEFAIMAANTTKPLEYLCEHPASLEVAIEMAAAIRGGRDRLRAKPYFLQLVTPLPLNYHAAHSDQIIAAVRAGVPVSVGTLPIGGASTPITTAGCMVNSLATDFAAMVLAQLVEPGCFCVGSSDVCFMEPATGAIGNIAQTALADMVMCQVRRRLGLPSFTGAVGYSSARRFNQDAVAELSYSMMQAFYSRPATLDYLGSLDQGLTFSMHALVLCDDLAGLLRTLWEGVRIDSDTLALDLAKEVGPRGNYLAHRHTVSHCRERLWGSRYFGARLPLSGDDRPDQDLVERIDADLRTLLADHVPAPLEAEVAAELAAIAARFAARHAA